MGALESPADTERDETERWILLGGSMLERNAGGFHGQGWAKFDGAGRMVV